MSAWASGEPTGVGCGDCGVYEREPEPTHDAPGSDGATAIGKDETAPSGAFVNYEHQSRQRVQSGS